jgi:SAM-dependent methyltransferase
MGVDYGAMKQMTKAIWSLGDYSPLARLVEPAARELVDACGISSGHAVLDVGAGNGNAAIAAAGRGARVVASDLTPALMDQGRSRAELRGLNIEWAEADAEDLPFEDNRFDAVISVFGAIFAPRPDVAASEMFRVLSPGGTLGMANWTPESFSKQMMDIVSKYSPAPPVELPSPFLWGEEQTVRSRLEPMAKSISFDRRSLAWEFESPEAMRAVFEAHGGAVMAKRTLPADAYQCQADEIEALVGDLNEGTQGAVLLNNEYLLVVARKA